MAQKAQERRRNFYINKKFQRNFIIKFCSLIVAGTIISGVIIFAMSSATVTTVFENSRLRIKSTADFILPAVLLSSAIVIVSIGLAAIIVTLLASHKIAGPLYRVEKDLEKVGAGDFKVKFNLRKGDQLQALAANVEKMVSSLRNAMIEMKNSLSEIEKTIGTEGSSISQDLKDKLRSLKKSLSKFEV